MKLVEQLQTAVISNTDFCFVYFSCRATLLASKDTGGVGGGVELVLLACRREEGGRETEGENIFPLCFFVHSNHKYP